MSEGLGLTEIRDRKWTIFESSAANGKGLTDGFDWYYWFCDYDN